LFLEKGNRKKKAKAVSGRSAQRVRGGKLTLKGRLGKEARSRDTGEKTQELASEGRASGGRKKKVWRKDLNILKKKCKGKMSFGEKLKKGGSKKADLM